MFKKLAFLVIVTFGMQLFAMEEEKPHQVLQPEFQKDVVKFVKAHLERKNASLGSRMVEDGVTGLMLPFGLGFGLGWYAVDKMPVGGPNGSFAIAPAAGMLTALLLSPIEIGLAIPSTLLGTVFGVGHRIYDGVMISKNEAEFDKHVAVHLLQWITTTKNARLAMRKELKAWQRDHEDCSESIVKTAEAVLNDKETFSRYFKNAYFSVEDLKKILATINPKKDNWNDFFVEVSAIVKMHEIKDEQWSHIAEKLMSYEPNKLSFDLTEKDIKEYLYISVYYFNLFNKYQAVDMINAFIK